MTDTQPRLGERAAEFVPITGGEEDELLARARRAAARGPKSDPNRRCEGAAAPAPA